VEGASVACACSKGGSGTQVCNAQGSYEPCSCEATTAGACSLAALKCDQYSADKLAGWALHKKVFEARNAKDYAKAICLALESIKSADTVLQGASHFESSHAWHGLGCRDLAFQEVETSLAVRPHGRSGWMETCAWCKQLGARCGACDTAATAPACPDERNGAALVKRALTTTHPITIVKCAAGKFPQPGFAFDVWEGSTSDDLKVPYNFHRVVLQESGALVAGTRREGTWHERSGAAQNTVNQLITADLDGDGTDEVVEESEYVRRGWIIGTVEVFAIKGEELVGAGSVPLTYSDGAMQDDPSKGTECTATWKLAPSGKGHIIEVTGTHASSGSKCVRGTQRHELRAGKLAKR
jgi:hypothetical protein